MWDLEVAQKYTILWNKYTQTRKKKKQGEEGNDLICHLAQILAFQCCYQQYARGRNYGQNSAS